MKKQIIPRIYQAIAVKHALKALRSKIKRALVVMATGLGKTLTAAMIAQKFCPKGKVLFLVHNNFILDHAVSEFKLIFGEDMDVAIYNGNETSRAAREKAHTAQFVFATWQTMGENLTRWTKNHFDLVIVDEAHHAEAATYSVTARYFTGAKLGTTATPERNDDADIRNIFGKEVVNIPLEEAIARGWLPPIDYRICHDESLNSAELKKVLEDIKRAKRRMSMAEINRRLFIRKKARAIVRMITNEGVSGLVFCSDIDHADRMANMLPRSRAFHSGKDPEHATQKRVWERNQRTLVNFRKGKLRYVTAVNAFNEGVDVPAINLIVLLRQHGVMNTWKQQIGRGCRPDADKPKLVVLDFVSNLEQLQFLLEMQKKIAQLKKKYEQKEKGDTSKSIEVGGEGIAFTFTQEIVDLMEILRSCQKDFYKTWQEASAAAIKLGIKTKEQYRLTYAKDLRLPSSPYHTYPDAPKWRVFLGGKVRNFYPYEHASRVVQKMEIKNKPQYTKRRGEDDRLPNDPPSVYRDLWHGWPVFCGEQPREICKSWRIAASIAKDAGANDRESYLKVCEIDTRLPRDPWTAFTDFPGWPKFFGRKPRTFKQNAYKTWQEAAKAALKLGARTCALYQKLRHKDPRLYADPIRVYRDCPDWNTFLGKKK